MNGDAWTESEVDTLRREWPIHGSLWEGWGRLLPGRSRSAIQEKASRERIGAMSFWSPDEIETLALHYQLHGPDWRGWASRLPGRTKSAIAQRAYVDGLTSHQKRFTRSEDAALLRMRAKGISYSICANRLGVTKNQVKWRLARLKSIYREGVA